MNRFRHFIYWIILVVLLPLVLLVSIELVLRLVHFGYPSSFVQTISFNDQKIVRDNPFYFYRFFPQQLARATSRFVIPQNKENNDCRIFVFGASAAMGDPDFSYSFSRMLEKSLQTAHSDCQFQVINAAATAINSHVVVPIVDECAEMHPDLFIVLLGNNEVIGPYGPTTILTPLLKSYKMIRFHIFFRSTKLGQLFTKIHTGIFGVPPELQEWGGLDIFAQNQLGADDPRLAFVYRHFEKNLERICRIAKKKQIPIILCTVPTNLVNCPPFYSQHSKTLNEKLKKEWQNQIQAGIEFESREKYSKAIQAFTNAAKLDSGFAELYYRLAHCQRKIGQRKEAKQHFIRARDLDALRFRTDSRLNAVIRNQAENSDAVLSDLDKHFQQQPQQPLQLFVDHVHFSFDGNYLITQSLFPLVEKVLSLPADSIPSNSEVLHDLACTGWDADRLNNKILERYSQPPFTEQIDHKFMITRMHAIQKIMQQLKTPEALQTAKTWYDAALAKHPGDWVLHENYGKFLLSAMHDPQRAETCFAAVSHFLPDDALTFNNLGATQIELEKWQEAEKNLSTAVELMPNLSKAVINLSHTLLANDKTAAAEKLVETHKLPNKKSAKLHNNIGIRLAEKGEIENGIQHLQTAIELDPDFAKSFYNLALVYKAQNNREKQLECLFHAVKLLPDDPNIQLELAAALREADRYKEAISAYNRYLVQRPDDTDAHNDLGILYAQLGMIDTAAAQFNSALAIDAENVAALSNLAMIFSLTGKHKEAIHQLEQISQFSERAEYPYKIGTEFLQLSKPDSARHYFAKAVELQPSFIPAILKLDSLNNIKGLDSDDIN